MRIYIDLILHHVICGRHLIVHFLAAKFWSSSSRVSCRVHLCETGFSASSRGITEDDIMEKFKAAGTLVECSWMRSAELNCDNSDS